MICRTELKRLQSHHDYPSISVLAPTHRTAPANKRDRIVVKNLVARRGWIASTASSRSATSLPGSEPEQTRRSSGLGHVLDGLALFASRDVATAIQLPFRVKARVVIDATFATRDLVFTLNRAVRYRVLVLTEKPTGCSMRRRTS